MDAYVGISGDHAWDRRGQYRLFSLAPDTSTSNFPPTAAMTPTPIAIATFSSEGSNSVAVVAQDDDDDEE